MRHRAASARRPAAPHDGPRPSAPRGGARRPPQYHTRLRVAEKMLKLPMSFFNARDLSELSSNIMTDCTNIETATSSIVPQLLANIASSVFVLICLAFFDWRMALSIFAMLPIAALVFWMSRKLQNRLFVKHISAKLASEKQSERC